MLERKLNNYGQCHMKGIFSAFSIDNHPDIDEGTIWNYSEDTFGYSNDQYYVMTYICPCDKWVTEVYGFKTYEEARDFIENNESITY